MKQSILAVDDQQVVIDAIKRILRHDPLQVDGVLTSAVALERLASADYHLVITDLMMPGIGGLELMQLIAEKGLNLPVVMITGYPTITTALQAKRLGAFEYVTKPFTRQELRSVVLRALRGPAAATDTMAHPAKGALAIPGHAWTRQLSPEVWLVGVEPALAQSVGDLVRVELPQAGEFIEQGRVAVLLKVNNGVEHSVHSPWSGEVLRTNARLEQQPDLARLSPRHEGWLFEMKPYQPDKERENLAPI